MMASFGTVFWKALHHDPADWLFLGLMFLAGATLVVVALWKKSDQRSASVGLSEEVFNQKLAEHQEKMVTMISSIVESRTKSDASVVHETAAESAFVPDPFTVQFSPLQRDALALSNKLFEFIEAQGEPPVPKYTKEQIDRMPLKESERLLRSNDKDYDFACEFYYGGNLSEGEPRTAEELQKQIMARFMLLDPWYEKVRAGYDLEFKDEVERMYNRFTIEGLADEVLKVPVQGKMGREYIREIAAKLWELANKSRVKEVKVEST